MRAKANPVAALLTALCVCSPPSLGAEGVTVLAHMDTPMLSEDVLQKVYLGKVVEVNGRAIIPVNLTRGSAVRKNFMEHVLTQDDEKFVAYWTVRRYIGKGTPPIEFSTIELQLQFLRSTPGAVGYVDESADFDTRGLRTLLRKP